MDYFGSSLIPKNRQALGAPPPTPRPDSMTRECARPYSQWTCLVDADAMQFGGKTKHYIFCSHPLSKNVLALLMVPLADALHCYAFAPVFNFLCPEHRIPSLRNCWLWTER